MLEFESKSHSVNAFHDFLFDWKSTWKFHLKYGCLWFPIWDCGMANYLYAIDATNLRDEKFFTQNHAFCKWRRWTTLLFYFILFYLFCSFFSFHCVQRTGKCACFGTMWTFSSQVSSINRTKKVVCSNVSTSTIPFHILPIFMFLRSLPTAYIKMQKDETFLLSLAQFSLFFIKCRQFYRCLAQIFNRYALNVWHLNYGNVQQFSTSFRMYMCRFMGEVFDLHTKKMEKNDENRTMENRMKKFFQTFIALQ